MTSLIDVNRCIAKTRKGTRCRHTVSVPMSSYQKPSVPHYFCSQHSQIIAAYQKHKQGRLGLQQGGNPITSIYNVAFDMMIPSCLDVLQCDWMTDITSAIPGLSSLITLMKY